MPAITLILTNAGRALLPANGGISAVQLTQVGLTATAVVPNAGLAALAGEFKRINTLSGVVTGADTVSLGILDESTDIYDARAFGLYTSTGTLFAVYGQATPFVEKAAESNVAMTIDIKFADVSAAELVFGDANFVIPAATQTIQGVIEIATDAEVAAKTDATRAVTPKGLWFAFSAWIAASFSDVWRSTNDGSGSGLDADLLDGVHGSGYVRKDGTPNVALSNGTVLAGSVATHQIDASPVQIREINYVGVAQSAITYAPALAFHWSNRAAGAIKMDATGTFHFLGNDVGGTAYRSIAASGFSAAGNTVWHAGNDGSGSGLDADTVDGKHASAFVEGSRTQSDGLVVSGHNATHGPFSGALSLREIGMVGNSQSSAQYAPSLSFHWQGVQALALKMTSDGSLRVRGNSTNINDFRDVYAGVFYSNNYPVWHSGNDGSGSTLDADLLDGQEGGYYANIPARLGYTPASKAGDTFTGAIRRDALFYLDLFEGINPILHFDADDYFLFTRASNQLTLSIGGAVQATFAADGVIRSRIGFAAGLNAVWHAGNDGSGSGLDADTLDGKHAAAFIEANKDTSGSVDLSGSSVENDVFSGALQIREIGRVGNTQSSAPYAPTVTFHWSNVIASAIKMTSDGDFRFRAQGTDPALYRNIYAAAFYSNGSTVWSASNDGSGSTLDADLLDGQEGGYYANIPARLGYTPVNQTSYTAADVLAKLLTADGSGSGLDADMLDGKHASEFMLAADFTHAGTADAGWRRGPDGFTDQWVRVFCNADNHVDANWPRAFTSVMNVQATPQVSADNFDDGAAVKAFDVNTFTVIRTSPSGNRENSYIFVRACGYTATPTP